jgi:hypothetical protein
MKDERDKEQKEQKEEEENGRGGPDRKKERPCRVRVGTTTITSITSPRGNQEADERGGARGSKEGVGAEGGRKEGNPINREKTVIESVLFHLPSFFFVRKPLQPDI